MLKSTLEHPAGRRGASPASAGPSPIPAAGKSPASLRRPPRSPATRGADAAGEGGAPRRIHPWSGR